MNRMPLCVLRSLLCLLLCPLAGIIGSHADAQPSKIKINQFRAYPFPSIQDAGNQNYAFVELFNSGDSSVNITGWTITNKTKSVLATIPAIGSYPAGSFLRIVFGLGTNDLDFSDNEGTVYTHGDSLVFSRTNDGIALYPSSTISDAVFWSLDGSLPAGGALSDAIALALWPAGTYVRYDSLNRFSRYGLCPDGVDHNAPTDWRQFTWGDYMYWVGPENPIQVLPQNGGVLDSSGFSLRWGKVTFADSFFVEVDDDSLYGSVEFSRRTVDTSAVVPGSLTTGIYFWRVRVYQGGVLLSRFVSYKLIILGSLGFNKGAGAAGNIAVPLLVQHKDTQLLCDWSEPGPDHRPGCNETAGNNGPWDNAHIQTAAHVNGCPHCQMYCTRASIAMVNNFYGGDLSMDRIAFEIFFATHAGPEGDLGHGQGTARGASGGAHGLGQRWQIYEWALGVAIARTVGKPSFATIKTEIDAGRPIYIDGVNHATVLVGYLDISIPLSSKRIQMVYINNPWPGSGAAFDYATYQPGGGGTWAQGGYFTLPAAGIAAVKQEASVTTDTDGDGIMDFDEGNGRFQSDPKKKDTDLDNVADKAEIRNYTFHDIAGYHPGHENDALDFPDIDHDGKRAENDCDSDNDGDYDGGEDINGNGNNPARAGAAGIRCDGETCQFDAADYCLKLSVDKDVYFLGEPVFVVDNHGSRETHTYHASTKYNYELGLGCPTKANGSPLTHDGSFSTDTGGHAKRKLVQHCLTPGLHYLTADVLDDFKYSTPDNHDPQTCWTCITDWFHGWHHGSDYTYHNPGSNWPYYSYPMVCKNYNLFNQTVTVSIETPWWWWCYQWPPILNDYWLGIGIPRTLVQSTSFQITPPAFLHRDSINITQCGGFTIRQFFPDSSVGHSLDSTFTDSTIVWFGYKIPNWQIPDSLLTTHAEFRIGLPFSTSQANGIRIRAGDRVYGWSPTPYDSISVGSSATFSFVDGWNLVSVPMAQEDYRKSSLFPFAVSRAFAYRGSYIVKDSLANGEGYWLKFSGPQASVLFGTELSSDTLDVTRGWNLIGSLTGSIPISSVVPLGTSISSPFFGYTDGYAPSNTIEPGKAYWVRVGADGKLALNASGSQTPVVKNVPPDPRLLKFNELTVGDASGHGQKLYFGAGEKDKAPNEQYELPPVPPEGVFDARFASQRMVEIYPPKLEKPQEFQIHISSAQYPLNIGWNVPADAEHRCVLAEKVEGIVLGSIILEGKGSLKVHDPKITSLTLRIESRKGIPVEFALRQSYPNPFNPSTTIEFDIPRDASVTLKIYDNAGREVTTLVDNRHFEAGTERVEFQASKFATGVYYYRIIAKSDGKEFVDVKKMLLLR